MTTTTEEAFETYLGLMLVEGSWQSGTSAQAFANRKVN